MLERKKAPCSPVPAGRRGGKVHKPERSQGVSVCLSPVVWLMGATVVLLNVVTEVWDAASNFYLLGWDVLSAVGSGWVELCWGREMVSFCLLGVRGHCARARNCGFHLRHMGTFLAKYWQVRGCSGWVPLVLHTSTSWRKAWLGSPSARSHPAGRMSLQPTTHAWEKAQIGLFVAKLIVTYPVAKNQLLFTGGATGSWQSHEDLPSCWEEWSLACSVPQLGQPAALYWAEWVYGGLIAQLKSNWHTLPWSGTGLLSLLLRLLPYAPIAAPDPEVPPSQLQCFLLSRQWVDPKGIVGRG